MQCGVSDYVLLILIYHFTRWLNPICIIITIVSFFTLVKLVPMAWKNLRQCKRRSLICLLWFRAKFRTWLNSFLDLGTWFCIERYAVAVLRKLGYTESRMQISCHWHVHEKEMEENWCEISLRKASATRTDVSFGNVLWCQYRDSHPVSRYVLLWLFAEVPRVCMGSS